MPAIDAEPELGFNSPQSIRIVVVFPAAFGPKSPNISPLFIFSESLFTTIFSHSKLYII